jgi:hypothetical protein
MEKCKKCNKRVGKLYEYKDDDGLIYRDICWACYNRLMDLDIRLAEIKEENEIVHIDEQCDSQEEYDYKRENGWIP